MNVGSVKAAVEEYAKAYSSNKLESLFADDLFGDSELGLALNESFNKPNAKQLGLA